MAGKETTRNEEVRQAILEAFRKAKAAKLDAPACYRAAIDVWCDLHPEQSRTAAAARVVSILQKEVGAVRDLARKLFESP